MSTRKWSAEVLHVALTIVLAVVWLAIPHIAAAQQAARLPQIGYLSNSSGGTPLDMEFLNGLRHLGWEDGRNVVIQGRYSSGDSKRFPELAGELVGLDVNVIVGWGPTPVAAAKTLTTKIPIIMMVNSDPAAAGLVTNVSRPEGNITGVAVIDDLDGKRLELAKEALPRLSRVAVLVNPDRPGVQDLVAQTQRAAESLGLHTEVFRASQPADFKRVFLDMKKARAQAVLVLTDVMYWTHRTDIAGQALSAGLPTIFPSRDYVAAGGLLSYSASFYDMAHRAASYVDKILKGARVIDLPIEQPTRFEFVINTKTANALGLSIPSAILLRTDELIR